MNTLTHIFTFIIGFGAGFLTAFLIYKKQIKAYGEYNKTIDLIADNASQHKLSIKIVDDKGDNNPENDDVEIHIDPISNK